MEWEGEEFLGDRLDLGNFPPAHSGAPAQELLAPACTAGIEVALTSNGLHGLDSAPDLTPNHSNPYSNFHRSALSSSGQYQNPYVRGQDLLPSRFPNTRGAYPSVHQFESTLESIYQRPSPISDYEDVPTKLEDEGNFSHLHHPTPAYLPPNSFLLSPISTHGAFFPVENPLPNTHTIDMPNGMEPEGDELTEDDKEPFLSPLQTPDLAPSSHVGDDDYLPDSKEDAGKMDSQNEKQRQHQQEELSCQQNSLNTTEENQDDDAPYAVLIYRALMSTPTRRMVLAQIYDYFRERIPKFRRIKGRGWMNSIRHNLSMNGVSFLIYAHPSSLLFVHYLLLNHIR